MQWRTCAVAEELIDPHSIDKGNFVKRKSWSIFDVVAPFTQKSPPK